MNYWFSLNNQEFEINEQILPLIIHWKEWVWVSLFSVLLIAKLINLDYKVIYYCEFEAGKNELLNHIDNEKIQQINYKSDLNKLDTTKSILIKPWNKDMLKFTLEKVGNNSNYILFVKNVDTLNFGSYKQLSLFWKTIFSGDFEKCSFSQTIVNKTKQNKIYFDLPNFEDKLQMPLLNKYECYFQWENEKWILKITFG